MTGRSCKCINGIVFYYVKLERKVRYLYLTTYVGTEVVDILNDVRVIGKLIVGADTGKKSLTKFGFLLGR